MVHKFSCGCHFPILQESPFKLDFKLNKIPKAFEGCPATWEVLARGLIQGVFQLNSCLGKRFTKKLKPESIEHLGGLGAVLRPGCLHVLDDKGRSVTEIYCLRKNGEDQGISIDPSLDEILAPTYFVYIFQETVLKIAHKLAQFNLVELDTLRKAIGKKLADELSDVGKIFVEKAEKVGIVSKEKATEIFEGIKKSSRYLFNKSHSIGYGKITFITAYLKAHFPRAFYLFNIGMADDTEEMEDLVEEAKLYNISVSPPLLTDLSSKLVLDGDNIRLGLLNIKKFGESHIKKVKDGLGDIDLTKITPFTFFCQIYPKLTPTVAALLIKAGTLRYLKEDRSELLYKLKVFDSLTDGELKWVGENWPKYTNLEDLLGAAAKTKKEGGACHGQGYVAQLHTKVQLLKNPPYSLKDSPEFIIQMERDLLGISLTYSPLDGKNVFVANCTVREFQDGRDGNVCMAVELKEISVTKTKKGRAIGKEMGFLTISDLTGKLDGAIIFAEAYEEFKDLLFVGNLVLCYGQRSSKGDSFIVNKVFQVK